MSLVEILSKVNIGLKNQLISIAQNDGGIDKNEIDTAKGFMELGNLLNGYDSKSNEYNLMSGLIVEYQNNGNVNNGKLDGPTKLVDKSVDDLINDGYQFVDEAYINVGSNECCFKIDLYSKPGQPLFYVLSTYSTNRDGKATSDEKQRFFQFLKDNYGMNSDEFLKRISYNTLSKNFTINIDKITGNNAVSADGADNNKISIYNKNDKEALRLYNEIINSPDEKTLRKLLNNIKSPAIYTKIEYMMNKDTKYKSDNLYSSLEKFVYDKLSDKSAFNYSSSSLELIVNQLIQNGAISGEDAIKAQARLAARLIFDGCDGFGTNEDVVDKGVHMIKSPIDTGNSEQNRENALKVLDELNKIVKKHNTFYGYGKTFEDLEKYLSDDLTKGQIDYANMIQNINGLKNSKFQPSDLKNIIQKYSSDPSMAPKIAVIQDMSENLLESIEDLYNSGIENGGVFADMADGISGIWNNGLNSHTVAFKFNKHGNKASLVKNDIVAYYNNIIKLTNSLDSDNFEKEFRNIFETDYNENNITNFIKAKNNYAVATYGETVIENLKKQRESLNKYDDITTIATIIRILDIEPEMQKEIEKRAKEEKLPLRYVYTQALDKFIDKASEGYNKMLDGKELKELKNDLEVARTNAFGQGPYSDIIKRVEDYNISQIKGASACQISTEILMVFGTMALTGGMSAAAGSSLITRLLAKEGISYGVSSGCSHFIAEMGNKASTYEGNTLDHTWLAFKESLIDGIFTSASETVVKKLLEKKFGSILLNKFGEDKIASVCTKCGLTAFRNFAVEEGKQYALTGSLNNNKSGLKALFSAIVKALVPGNGKVSKYLLDKGTRKMATNVAYNEFCKDFNIRTLIQQNSDVKALMEELTEEEFVSLVNGIIDEILIEAQNEIGK